MMPEKGAETASFSYRRVQEARYILRNNPLLAKEVAAGNVHFDRALAEGGNRAYKRGQETWAVF
jgi:hypothetical protein